MALSLPGERSLAAATPANPFAAFVRWIAKAKAARARRVALSALLELDHARLNDLGISRNDITAALAAKSHAAPILNAARARNDITAALAAKSHAVPILNAARARNARA